MGSAGSFLLRSVLQPWKFMLGFAAKKQYQVKASTCFLPRTGGWRLRGMKTAGPSQRMPARCGCYSVSDESGPAVDEECGLGRLSGGRRFPLPFDVGHGFRFGAS